jgi:hypothetical protein
MIEAEPAPVRVLGGDNAPPPAPHCAGHRSRAVFLPNTENNEFRTGLAAGPARVYGRVADADGSDVTGWAQ